MYILKADVLGWEQDRPESGGCIQPSASRLCWLVLPHQISHQFRVCNTTEAFTGTDNLESPFSPPVGQPVVMQDRCAVPAALQHQAAVAVHTVSEVSSQEGTAGNKDRFAISLPPKPQSFKPRVLQTSPV